MRLLVFDTYQTWPVPLSSMWQIVKVFPRSSKGNRCPSVDYKLITSNVQNIVPQDVSYRFKEFPQKSPRTLYPQDVIDIGLKALHVME